MSEQAPPPAAPEPLNQADHHKHMEFVQGVITRLAGNSFLIKGWSLTVTTAVIGYAIVHSDWRIAILGTLSPLAFWYLDSYFLASETKWRSLFADVASGKVRAFRMPYDSYDVSRRKILVSPTLRWFYGPILAASLIVLLVTSVHAIVNTLPGDHPELRPSCRDSKTAPGARCCQSDRQPSEAPRGCGHERRFEKQLPQRN